MYSLNCPTFSMALFPRDDEVIVVGAVDAIRLCCDGGYEALRSRAFDAGRSDPAPAFAPPPPCPSQDGWDKAHRHPSRSIVAIEHSRHGYAECCLP